MRDVDLALIAGEAHGEPFLRLPAILSLPSLPHDVTRDVIGEPILALAELLDRADVGLLVELAQSRRPRVLARIDAALWHLPFVRGIDVLLPVDALADEHAAGAIEHHHADAGAIGEGLEGRHAISLSSRPSER